MLNTRGITRILVGVAAATVGLSALSAPASALPAPNQVTLDAAQYLPASTVTVTGTGWTCSTGSFPVSVTVLQGTTAIIDAGFPTVVDGGFTVTFEAPPTLGTFTVRAADQACGTTNVDFEVVAQLPTTTTAPPTTATTAPNQLPPTGRSSTANLAVVGAVVAVAGIAVVLLARGRRKAC